MKGKRRRPPIPAISERFGQILGRPEEKTEYLGVCFERQFAPNPPADWDFGENVEDEVENFLSLPVTSVPEPISRDEVSDQIVALRPR